MKYYLAIHMTYWHNNDDLRGHDKWKKSDSEDHILYDPIYMK